MGMAASYAASDRCGLRQHAEHHVGGAGGVQHRVGPEHIGRKRGAAMVMAAGSHNGPGGEAGQSGGGFRHAAHRAAAGVGHRHRTRVQAGGGEQLFRPLLAAYVETHGAAGDRVVGGIHAGQLEDDVVFHDQPPMGAPEHVGFMLAQPQDRVQRQKEADRLAGDPVDSASPDVLAPPLRLRLGAAVEPTDRRVQPTSIRVDRYDRLSHAYHRQRLDLSGVRHLADHLSDVFDRGLPQRRR